MKHLILGAALSLAAAGAQADAIGLWATEKNDEGQYLTVEIKPCGEKLCGFIQSAVDGDGVANPNYQHLGRQMIFDMVPDGPGKWDDGKIWAPDADETYSSNMELDGDVLTVEGCVIIICRGQDWTRVN